MLFQIALVIVAFASLVAFVLYGADKQRAKRGAWRIPEKVLLGIGFLCGAPGALLGMKLFRHKTQHVYFYIVNVLGLLWQVALLVWLFIKFMI
jgi:uncharacterized membrane protein YsdA (DUF1294 family)